MKAWEIKRARKKILSKGYYEKRVHELQKIYRRGKEFRVYRCCTMFVTEEVALKNLEIYNRDMPIIARRLIWYKKKLNIK